MRKLYLGLPLIALAMCQSNTAAADETHGIYHIRKNSKFLLGSAYALHLDCTSRGKSFTTIIHPPGHGAAYVTYGRDYPAFRSGPYVVCNKKRVPATELWYRPQRGYIGTDTFSVHNWFPTGNIEDKTLYLTVE